MKRSILILAMPILMAACVVETPRADFSVSSDFAYTNEDISFYNNSWHADSYEWDFGDGYISNSTNPVHAYIYPGVYNVTLKAISYNHYTDVVSMRITIDASTRLEVQVREYYQNYVVPGASVILYPTLADWENETNAVAEGTTDRNGIVIFYDLDPSNYYLDIWEAHHNNYQLAAEDVGFIRTARLYRNEYNTITAYVDYFPDGKKNGLVRAVNTVTGRKFEVKQK